MCSCEMFIQATAFHIFSSAALQSIEDILHLVRRWLYTNEGEAEVRWVVHAAATRLFSASDTYLQ